MLWYQSLALADKDSDLVLCYLWLAYEDQSTEVETRKLRDESTSSDLYTHLYD